MSNIKHIALAKYNLPKITENKRKKWVEYGENNDFYQKIIDSADSTTNAALINGISQMIYGKGLHATDAARKPDEYAAMMSLFTEDKVRMLCHDDYFFGSTAIQVIYNKQHNKIVEIDHLPIQNLRPSIANDEGEIESYFYSDDWSKVKPNDKPTEIPSFGTSKKGLEVLVVKNYIPGHYYFCPPSWISGMTYAYNEIEIGKFHLNNIYNRFSGNTIINFNNGRPNDDEQRDVVRDLEKKHTGSEGNSVVVAFNDNKESATTVEQLSPLNIHEQYDFLSRESSRKLIVAHKVTSPLLFGLPNEGTWSSNADEIQTASLLFDNTVIKPIQRVLVEHFQKILNFNKVNLNLYFVTSQPLDFTEVENDEVEEEVKEEKTGVEMARHICCASDVNDGVDEIADDLISLGEDESDEWELVEETDVDYSEDEQTTLKKILNLVSTGTARPNAKSDQDKTVKGVQYKTRYIYSPLAAGADSRAFCKKMVSANKIYRKEDIIAMDGKIVNAGFGVGGANTYSIWKYKGGARCHHKWLRRVYKKVGERGSIDVKNPNAETISTNASEKAGYRVRNPKEVAMKPDDMPNNGFVNPR